MFYALKAFNALMSIMLGLWCHFSHMYDVLHYLLHITLITELMSQYNNHDDTQPLQGWRKQSVIDQA